MSWPNILHPLASSLDFDREAQTVYLPSRYWSPSCLTSRTRKVWRLLNSEHFHTHLSKHSILQLLSDIRRDNECQQRVVRKTLITFVNVWCTVGRLIDWPKDDLLRINLLLPLNCPDAKSSNLPDDVMWSRPIRNADPGVHSQSRENIRRRSRRSGEQDETAMMLGRDTEEGMREGQRHSDYNYQLDSIMTCPCEKPSFPHCRPPPSLCLSLSFSLPRVHKLWVSFIFSQYMWNLTRNRA